MNTPKSSFRLAAIVMFASVAASVAIACSGDNSNGTPTVDGGMTADSTAPGDDSSMMNSDSSMTTDSNMNPVDSPSLDTGSCMSDAGTCNSCYSAAQASADPYNACSVYGTACQRFDATRVPSHGML